MIEKRMIPYVVLFLAVLGAYFWYTGYRTTQEADKTVSDLRMLRADDIASIAFRTESGEQLCFRISTPNGTLGVLAALKGAVRFDRPASASTRLAFTVDIRRSDGGRPSRRYSGRVYDEYPNHVFLTPNWVRGNQARHIIQVPEWMPWIMDKYRHSPCRAHLLE